jgi:hypothetical protein
LRLTNDRASKRASAWATARVPLDDWSTTIRFRVSGQGRRLFGDGLAFWFTKHNAHKDGPLHGFTDTFTGFGLVFDTYVNTEPGHVHKDVQIVSSDGKAPRKLDDSPVGCDADFRYWEGRDDWSVYNHSAVRIRFASGRVSVWMDPRATGVWTQCLTDVALAAPEGWWREGEGGAWMGITATTGELADNHDILSVQTGPEDEVAPLLWLEPRPEMQSSGSEQIDSSIRSAVAYENWVLKERLAFLGHQLEHQCVPRAASPRPQLQASHHPHPRPTTRRLSTLDDSIKMALKKMADSDKDQQRRIAELEARVGAKVAKEVEEKLGGAGGATADLGSRLATIEKKVASEVLPKVAEIANKGSGWVKPFVGLTVVVIGLGVWFLCFRNWSKKKHGYDDLPYKNH